MSRTLAEPAAPAPALPVALIIWAALGIALNVGVARFTYGVMLPSLRRDLALDYLAGGALNAVHLLGYLVGTLLSPQLARRIGMATFSMLAHLVVAAGAVICALAPEQVLAGPLVLGLGRLITGLGAGGGIMAVMVIAFAAVPAERRPLVSAVVWSGMGVATIISGLAAPLLLASSAGWRTAFAVSAVLALLIAIAFPPRGAPLAVEPPDAAASPFAVAELAHTRWLFLLMSYFLFAFGYIAYSTFAGARLAATQAPMVVIQLTWTVLGAASIAGAALTLPLLNAPSLRRYALFATFVLGGVGALVSALDAPFAALGGGLLVGLGVAGTPTIVTAYARERCSAADYARAFSFAAAALGTGQLLGPVIAGEFADIYGTVAVPLLAALAYGVGAVLALLDGRVISQRTSRPSSPMHP